MKLAFWIIIAIVVLFIFSSFFIRIYWFTWRIKYIALGIVIGLIGGFFVGKKFK